jgi:hypothetical protein
MTLLNLLFQLATSVATNDTVIQTIVESRYFSPETNQKCHTGKYLLHYLCSSRPNTDLYRKVNDLFLKKPEKRDHGQTQNESEIEDYTPVESKDDFAELLKIANGKENYDIVWILLREIADRDTDLDLKKIKFFRAIMDGHRRDNYNENENEDTFLHVFARNGFHKGIAYVQKHFETESSGRVSDIESGSVSDVESEPCLSVIV